MRLVIRCDASIVMGTGHLMRCLTLADRVSRDGGEVLFVARVLAGDLDNLIRSRGHTLTLLQRDQASESGADTAGPEHKEWLDISWASDADQTRRAARRWGGADWLVVDHYALDNRWEQAVRPEVGRLMVIDDLADRRHECDLLLDQNYFPAIRQRYSSRVLSTCRLLLGPRYALLRPEFAARRPQDVESVDPVRRILVFFGGSDAGNETCKAIEAFLLLNRPDIGLDVVVGATNPHRAAIEDACDGCGQISVYWQVQDMASLMARTDLVVGAGGSSSWERCALQLPTVAWPLAENQRPVLDALADLGAVCVPDTRSVATATGLSAHLYAAIHNAPSRRRMAVIAGAQCDGLGVDRVMAAMSGFAIAVRPANAEDGKAIFTWRNDATVRSFSDDAEPIAWDMHCTWMQRTLANPDRLLLVAERDDTPVAVIRFDIDGAESTVSIFAVPGLRAVGAAALAAAESYLHHKRPQVRRVTARVLATNRVSAAMFEAGGYIRMSMSYEKELQA